MSEDRSWMYNRYGPDGYVNPAYLQGLLTFREAAENHALSRGLGGMIRCPCKRCRNGKIYDITQVEIHLMSNGFVERYYIWEYHGEDYQVHHNVYDVAETSSNVGFEGNQYMHMLEDGLNLRHVETQFEFGGYTNEEHDGIREDPNTSARTYYDLMEAVNQPLWDGCTEFTKLSMTTQLVSLKSESQISQQYFQRWISLIKRCCPNEGENIPNDFYEAKKLLSPLFLPKQKIHACVNNCMLFYKEDEQLVACRFCGESRYEERREEQRKPIARKVLIYMPLAPRLQRLYMSRKTAQDMTWHHRIRTDDGWMTHPRDGAAWKHFDATYPDFGAEPRNVRIGLCTDGFAPFGKFGRQYSCWPVIVCVYNLPPGLCMKEPYLFLSLIIPGPKNPGRDIDIFLRPLVEELKELWHTGVETFDASREQNFNMRVALMWTISDFPAYGMLSGWSTHGRLACPYCMEHTKAFRLREGRKFSWFDCHRPFLPVGHPFRMQRTAFVKGRTCQDVHRERLTGAEVYNLVSLLEPDVFGQGRHAEHRTAGYNVVHNWCKRSIFWDLSYWSTNKIRHNIDFMHTEKNNGENILHTVVDVPGKTKDNERARIDLETHCSRPQLHMHEIRGRKAKPKALYTLTTAQQKEFRSWLARLKLPDGYASNISRCARNVNFSGLKSHDVHIIVQKLLPVGLRHVLPDQIWETVTEWCFFFRDISSTTLNVLRVEELSHNIVEIICKMETIFPPAFFDVMEHLPIHLPYEALNGGPVQYRWMYPFESFLGGLKKMVRQKARVEGSICEAYLVKEVSNFCSMYFEEGIETDLNRPGRHDVPNEPEDASTLPLFRYPGRGTFVVKHRYFMTREQYTTAQTYILCNTPEVREYIQMYHDLIEELQPHLTEEQINHEVSLNFSKWFHNYIRNNMETLAHLRTLASGPNTEIKRYKGYYVNGYYFDIRQGDRNKSTYNSGVSVKGTCYDDDDHVDYYGVIEEIWELSYGFIREKVVLFKCYWFDTSRWMQIHPRNGMVQIKHKSRASKDDPFILASQAQQVYYLRYISASREHKQWCVAMKTNARSLVDWTHMQNVDVSSLNTEDIFQEEQQPPPVLVNPSNNVDVVAEGIFQFINEDDLEHDDVDASEYASDYPDNDLDSEEGYFGNNTSEGEASE